jgi:MFS family permease
MLGSTLSNILWAYLSDYVGNKRVIQTSAFISLLIPIVALLITKQLSELFIVLFVLIGFSMAGGVIGYMNFLLDITLPKDRPTYISLNGTLTAPIMVFPLIGGIMIQYTSYKFMLIVTIATILIGLILSLWLREPRKHIINKIKR